MESAHKLTFLIISITAPFILTLVGMNWYTDINMAKLGLCYAYAERPNTQAQNQWQRCK